MKPLSATIPAVVLAVGIAMVGDAVGRESPQHPATPAGVRAFLKEANTKLLEVGRAIARASWTFETYITPDTEIMVAEAAQPYVTASTFYAKEAFRFKGVTVDPIDLRQLSLLQNSVTMSAPPEAEEAAELTRLMASMEATYGSGKYCPPEKSVAPAASAPVAQDCLDIGKITQLLAKDRDPLRLRELWDGWHTVSPPMRKDYSRFVELSNKGAKVLGFVDTGGMWRSRYDMPASAFAKELDRLWEQLRPLYLSLHAYTRARLREKYGNAVPASGPIPAHLLGNLWQQDWSNIYDLLATEGQTTAFSLTDLLKAKGIDALEMVRIGERAFSSLGFAPLPKTFWERSLFVKPRDREVVCQASAVNMDAGEDLRIKMCIDVNAQDFSTIHHELGHLYYERAYNTLPYILQAGANDGFHEALGDVLALSITPEYLVTINLLDKAPDASADTGLLLRAALNKLPFLPFSFLVDQWRWQVFSGAIAPAEYNSAWWALKLKYQGVAPPAPRGEEYFDPGAKYHIPGNTPYARYFLANVLQFQFHRALARLSGCTTPLHRCSIYGNAEVGKKLRAMMELGASRPWPDALQALTGERELDATAIVEYFAPLRKWLDEQNRGSAIGW